MNQHHRHSSPTTSRDNIDPEMDFLDYGGQPAYSWQELQLVTSTVAASAQTLWGATNQR
jgi:hypothetical protein